MAKKRLSPSAHSAAQAAAKRPSVTADRFARLYRLLQLLATAPQTRSFLTRRLKLDVRGFYRDLEILRQVHIPITLEKSKYRLTIDISKAVAQLPFPDPHLTLGEVMQVARGRTVAHQRLKEMIESLTS